MFSDFQIRLLAINAEQFIEILDRCADAFGEDPEEPNFAASQDNVTIESYQPLDWDSWRQDLVALSIQIPNVTMTVENFTTGKLARIKNGTWREIDTEIFDGTVGAHPEGKYAVRCGNTLVIASAESQQEAEGWALAQFGLRSKPVVSPATHADVYLASK